MTTRTRDPKAPAAIPPGQWTFALELVEPQPATGKRNTLGAIRLAFPDAGSAHSHHRGEPNAPPYCVGGAVHSYATDQERPEFPETGLIASALMVLNADLEEYAAFEFADTIVGRNDQGDVEGAWEAVAEALTWPSR